eukprot:scaffold7673_cov258-Pinguiococcus_pyrenoidosus.AAC.11
MLRCRSDQEVSNLEDDPGGSWSPASTPPPETDEAEPELAKLPTGTRIAIANEDGDVRFGGVLAARWERGKRAPKKLRRSSLLSSLFRAVDRSTKCCLTTEFTRI